MERFAIIFTNYCIHKNYSYYVKIGYLFPVTTAKKPFVIELIIPFPDSCLFLSYLFFTIN